MRATGDKVMLSPLDMAVLVQGPAFRWPLSRQTSLVWTKSCLGRIFLQWHILSCVAQDPPNFWGLCQLSCEVLWKNHCQTPHGIVVKLDRCAGLKPTLLNLHEKVSVRGRCWGRNGVPTCVMYQLHPEYDDREHIWDSPKDVCPWGWVLFVSPRLFRWEKRHRHRFLDSCGVMLLFWVWTAIACWWWPQASSALCAVIGCVTWGWFA